MQLSIFLLLCSSIILGGEKTKISHNSSYISEKAAIKMIDEIYTTNRDLHEKYKQSIKIMEQCIQSNPGKETEIENFLWKYIVTKKFSAYADVLESIQLPQNIDFLDKQNLVSDEDELTTIKKCITYFDNYHDLAIERIRTKDDLDEEQEKDWYRRFETIQKLYVRNDCTKLLDKIDFAKQLKKENASFIEKILKACEDLNVYIGYPHPINWLKWTK